MQVLTLLTRCLYRAGSNRSGSGKYTYRPLFAGLIFLCLACGKEKLDFTYDNRPESYEPSQVRVVNLALYRQVAGPDGRLTRDEGTESPTLFFPDNGLMGRHWSVPKSLFGEMGETELTFSDLFQVTPSIPVAGETLSLKLRNLDGPMDYYLIWPRGTGQPDYVRIPREESAPGKPEHIKIRLINLMKAVDPLPASSRTGPIEHLDGAITLTYADGTPIGPGTSNVPVSQGASDYVEIPYGTYQFRVLTEDGRQISATVHGVNDVDFLYRRIDPPSSRMPVPVTNGGITGLTYAPIQTYQPGGVYSIVVSPFPFDYLVSNYYEGAYQNQFKIIEDIAPPANLKYGKLQCINAMVGEQIRFQVNGTQLGGELPFGSASDYRILPAGTEYQVEAVNSNGTVIATLDYPLQAGQNHSVWLWADGEGSPRLIPVSNDLSSEFFVDRYEDNGTHNRYENTMALSTRFLNLSSDVPYLSLTINNGQDMREVSQLYAQGGGHYVQHSDEVMYNLQPGVVGIDLPYARWRTDYAILFEWMAYRSKPGVTPGVWAEDIPVFDSRDLLVNPALYTEVGRALPSVEPGVYTLALVGRTGDVPLGQKARIIAIKHNK